MKKTTLCFLLFSMASQAQLVVTADQHTPTELVNNIFASNNNGSITNITSSTGTDFGSVNGIGYFENSGTDFPFANGLLLTSGSALAAPGPNTTLLSDGSDAWLGDPELDGPGILAKWTKNASKIEFDFIPLADNISFNFLFASDNYGDFQCEHPGVVVFVLTNTTGLNRNLAIIPGSNFPISVITIRDNKYNEGCASYLPEYFGAYYGTGGASELTAPINYNGITVPMKASAAVIPGDIYHLKLVVANLYSEFDPDGYIDRDCAVFLEGGSFNTGTVLSTEQNTFNIQPLIYPNPSNGLLNISIAGQNLKTIGIYDLVGKNVKIVTNLSSNQTAMDVSLLAKGVYMVEVTSDANFTSINKLVIQ